MANKRDTILLVDDQELNRTIIRSAFEMDYNVLEAENGEQGLLLANQYHKSLAAMLLDVVMPKKDGYQVLRELGASGLLNEFPVVIITAEDSTENKVRAFDLGASDIIAKPFEIYIIKRRVQNIIDLNLQKQNQAEIIQEQAEKLRESNSAMIDALSSIVEYRSLETGQHVKRIRLFTKTLLEDIAKSYPEYLLDQRKIDIIVSASSMHDIGKIAIPDSILNKPGRLTPEEFEIMKTHTIKGGEMIASLDKIGDKEYLQFAYNICRYHHERWDGRGYPEGLKGDSIPICAQVVAIADCYDALTNDRVYKKALPAEEAINMILNGECGTFNPLLLESFKNVENTFEELTREYSDSAKTGIQKDFAVPAEKPIHIQDQADTLKMGQLKYFALLAYMKSTVMEVNFITGLYHIVYLASDDFESLKNGATIEKSLKSFAAEAVHPDDQSEITALSGQYADKMFEEGMKSRSKIFRLYSKGKKEYINCQVTMMRIDTNSPSQRQCLIIWHPFEERAQLPTKTVFDDTAIADVVDATQVFHNDKYLTIDEPSKSLLKFTGYREEEISGLFHNRFISMVYEADRDALIKDIERQISGSFHIENEFRIMKRDGSIVWVLNKSKSFVGDNGDEYLHCVIFDVTQSKKAQEELRLLMERYKIVMEQTNDVVFEWDAQKDLMTYSSNCEEKLGFHPISERFSQQIAKASHIHPEDMPLLAAATKSVKDGKPYREFDIRLADKGGRYRWFKGRVAIQLDPNGRLSRAVGTLSDIDSEKRKQDLIQSKAERDSLTMLLNKMTASDKVKEYLDTRKSNEKSALLIIDIDDFKSINDCYGHMFGDIVLQEISSELQKVFSSDDILARIGGDEFLILIKNVQSSEMIEKFAHDFEENVQHILLQSMKDFKLSCSIGIAICPNDGDNYQTLFRHADMALYSAKAKGKRRYVLFDPSSTESNFLLGQAKMLTRTIIDSENEERSGMDPLVQEVFQTLYNADNIDSAIYTVLKLIGLKFGISRVYIFEDNEDGSRSSNTYEWCEDGVTPQKNQLQNIPTTTDGVNFFSMFNDDGLFYCTDVSSLSFSWVKNMLASQAIKSCLISIITNQGKPKGFVGFDDCRVKRVWTKEQISTLLFISKLISSFLFKDRDVSALTQQMSNLNDIINSEEVLVAAVNPSTKKVFFYNKALKEAYPDLKIGADCFNGFFRSSTPCSACLMEKASKGQLRINPNNGKQYMFKAVDSTWDGTKAKLILGFPVDLGKK
ncbi:MAG: diguanylate cyclase [Bacilli bacterium]|nr:diguanylate cyclase [Bacilli bacterium]